MSFPILCSTCERVLPPLMCELVVFALHGDSSRRGNTAQQHAEHKHTVLRHGSVLWLISNRFFFLNDNVRCWDVFRWLLARIFTQGAPTRVFVFRFVPCVCSGESHSIFGKLPTDGWGMCVVRGDGRRRGAGVTSRDKYLAALIVFDE